MRVNAFTEIDIHLLLRGFLTCQRCRKPLSGSGSRGNGSVYYYYHCQSVILCQERFQAETSNEIFVKQLSKIAINAPIIDYYCQIIRTTLQTDNKRQEQEFKGIQTDIDKYYQRIRNAWSMRLDDGFTAEEFKDIKTDLLKKIEELERRKTKLLSTKDNYLEYLSYGEEIIKNIATRYITASPVGKKRIIGSIFPEKLIFSENQLRTAEPDNTVQSGPSPPKTRKGRKYLRPFRLCAQNWNVCGSEYQLLMKIACQVLVKDFLHREISPLWLTSYYILPIMANIAISRKSLPNFQIKSAIMSITIHYI